MKKKSFSGGRNASPYSQKPRGHKPAWNNEESRPRGNRPPSRFQGNFTKKYTPDKFKKTSDEVDQEQFAQQERGSSYSKRPASGGRSESRGYESRGSESRGYESRGYESRDSESRGYQSRGYQSRGYQSRGSESRGYNSHGSRGKFDRFNKSSQSFPRHRSSFQDRPRSDARNIEPISAEKLLFGFHPVFHALSLNYKIKKLLIQKGLQHKKLELLLSMCKDQKVNFRFEEKTLLDAYVQDIELGLHQGFIAELGGGTRFIEDFNAFLTNLDSESSDPQLIVLSDGIQDERNLGALSRSAVFFGVRALVCEQKGSAPISASVHKSSAGASLMLPYHVCSSLRLALETLKEHDFKVIGTMPSKAPASTGKQDDGQPEKILAPIFPEDLAPSAKTVLILGNEGSGIRQSILALCDSLVTLPSGKELVEEPTAADRTITSLNVSATAAILLYMLHKKASGQTVKPQASRQTLQPTPTLKVKSKPTLKVKPKQADVQEDVPSESKLSSSPDTVALKEKEKALPKKEKAKTLAPKTKLVKGSDTAKKAGLKKAETTQSATKAAGKAVTKTIARKTTLKKPKATKTPEKKSTTKKAT